MRQNTPTDVPVKKLPGMIPRPRTGRSLQNQLPARLAAVRRGTRAPEDPTNIGYLRPVTFSPMFVHPSVREQDHAKRFQAIFTKPCTVIDYCCEKNLLNFGGFHPAQNGRITVAAQLLGFALCEAALK